ncbi:hypothetical protein GQ457_09G003960 [Hibiscus cannabinus]
MAKDNRYMQELGQVAPSLVMSQSHYKTMACPRLEPIPEEECDDVEVLEKRVFLLLLLPVLFSLSVYVFLHRTKTIAKDVRYMQELGEVAPSLVIFHYKPRSCRRLEPIAEEECSSVEVLKKRISLHLPILLSLFIGRE